MALCCDIRLATTDATFALPEVPLGMIPFASGSQTLPRTIGRSRALDLLLTGRTISAQEAFEFGLIHQIVDKHDLIGKALDQANILASLSPSAVASLKSVISRGSELPLEDAIKLERYISIRVNR